MCHRDIRDGERRAVETKIEKNMEMRPKKSGRFLSCVHEGWRGRGRREKGTREERDCPLMSAHAREGERVR